MINKMNKYIKYLNYLIKHKYYTLKACWEYELYWQGLVHDLSKFSIVEFMPYVNFFYERKNVRDKTGYYKPTDTGDKDFELAWLNHMHNNKHHWQYWCIASDSGGIDIRPMPHKYRLEMLCDWW